MENISATNFDPFNHGTTCISYGPVTGPEYERLSRTLERGWGQQRINGIEQILEGPKKVNNYRIRIEGDMDLLLKQSHITEPKKQELINRCLMYLKSQDVLAPSLIPSQGPTTYFVGDGGHIFGLYPFITNGELFDGSREELAAAATEFAKLHKTLVKIPYASELREMNGEQISHDKSKLDRIAEEVGPRAGITEFDTYSASILKEIDEASKRVSSTGIDQLPIQTVHNDFHPHNVLFNKGSKKVVALLDFDNLAQSQRIRDVSFGMHRLSRTYGEQTERKNDCGANIWERAKIFLDAYNKINPLTDEEVKSIPQILEDEALDRVLTVLAWHYLDKNSEWSFDLPKQVITLREAQFFNF